jgi:tetratricopeptide (TPR) repeat protein
MKIKQLLLLVSLCLIQKPALSNSAPWVGADLKGLTCSGEGQGFGPYDYTSTADKNIKSVKDNPLNLVERAHFTPEVENLIKGNTGTLEGDLSYTLRAWPNHHRALLSIINYQLNIQKKLMPGKLSTPPECYLQRAINFSPEDAASYSLYGYYLRKIGHLEEAVKYYEKSLTLAPENAKFAYSFSLLLIDLKRYEDAVKYAKIAYRQGRVAPKGLKQKLFKLGVWNE